MDKTLDYTLKIEPTPYETSEFIDYFENTNNFMLIEESHTKLKVIANQRVERNIEEINEYMEKLKNIPITVKEQKDRLKSFIQRCFSKTIFI